MPAIRERMVSHLLNIDETLANTVAGKLGLQKMPKPADAAVPTRRDLDPSPALSTVENGPKRFEGRKLGILVTDGSDAGLLRALKGALDKAGATYEIIAPTVTGVKAGDGSWIEADQMIDGGPSVLYDAVALLLAQDAMDDLLRESSARDFVADAFAHCKFIGYVEFACRCLQNPASPPTISMKAAWLSAASRKPSLLSIAWPSCGSGTANPTSRCPRKGETS